MGQKKSSEFRWLFRHLIIQWIFFAFGLVYFVGPVVAIAFATLNCVVHGIIDWNIWNLYKLSAYKRIVKQIREEYKTKFGEATAVDDVSLTTVTAPELYKEKVAGWKYWEDHWFYSTIGFDQLLHTLTIIGLFALLV